MGVIMPLPFPEVTTFCPILFAPASMKPDSALIVAPGPELDQRMTQRARSGSHRAISLLPPLSKSDLVFPGPRQGGTPWAPECGNPLAELQSAEKDTQSSFHRGGTRPPLVHFAGNRAHRLFCPGRTSVRKENQTRPRPPQPTATGPFSKPHNTHCWSGERIGPVLAPPHTRSFPAWRRAYTSRKTSPLAFRVWGQ